ncbi:MAG: hypothetical protein GTO02_15865 [Candidatus Dadabacteria bacterium]|nr:hypothetical protein [Candidatus Dadabacteria bacterium]
MIKRRILCRTLWVLRDNSGYYYTAFGLTKNKYKADRFTFKPNWINYGATFFKPEVLVEVDL